MSREGRIELKTTEETKKVLQEKAEISQKSLTQYLIDAGLEKNYNSEKSKFYQNINSDLAEIKIRLENIENVKSQFDDSEEKDLLYLKEMAYTDSRLLMMILLKQYNNDEVTVKKIFDEALDRAEKYFKEKFQSYAPEEDLLYLKEMAFVNSKLAMIILNIHSNDKELVKSLYDRALTEAKKLFKN